MKNKIASLLSGMIFMIVFGIVDNLGLLLGMDINPFLTPNQDPLLSAMWGNTFSDFLGAVFGAIAAYIFLKLLKIKPAENLFIEIVGVTIGCLIPIVGYILFNL